VDENGVTYRKATRPNGWLQNRDLGRRRHTTRSAKLWPLARKRRPIATADQSHTPTYGPNYPDIFVVGRFAAAATKKGSRFRASRRWRCKAASTRKSHSRATCGQGGAKAVHYFNKGELAVIGRAAAVATFLDSSFGMLAWLIWLFIHLITSSSFKASRGFCSMGIRIPHVQPRRAPHHGS